MPRLTAKEWALVMSLACNAGLGGRTLSQDGVVEAKLDKLYDAVTDVRERIARLEAQAMR